jgi:transcriptional regulator GlxA family with amidase domain
MTRTVIGFTGLLILLFAIYSVVQWFKTKRHNRFLAQQITETAAYKAKYRALENEEHSTSQTPQPTSQAPLSTLSDTELFTYLRNLIESEKLYLAPNFERQILIDRTGLSKERIGAAFAQGSDHERLTTLIRELRLDHAVHLMNEHPEFTVEQVCQASGFANADTFTRNFKAKFGMTPTAYRGILG